MQAETEIPDSPKGMKSLDTLPQRLPVFIPTVGYSLVGFTYLMGSWVLSL